MLQEQFLELWRIPNELTDVVNALGLEMIPSQVQIAQLAISLGLSLSLFELLSFSEDESESLHGVSGLAFLLFDDKEGGRFFRAAESLAHNAYIFVCQFAMTEAQTNQTFRVVH